MLFVREVDARIVLKNLNHDSFDFGECTNDSAQVRDYEGVDDSFQLHGAYG